MPSLPAATASQTARLGETVLVVEDEALVRGLIVEVLGALGYRVIEAADGPSGLTLLQSSQHIDLLVTDIGLPRLNGRQMVDAARLTRPALKVLFMTGYAENAAMASGFLQPGMAMITKPFAMEALAAKVREAISDPTVESSRAAMGRGNDAVDEVQRQASLDALAVLDSEQDQAYDDLTRAAAGIFGVDIALISLVDRDRQWFKSRVGLQASQTPREFSFCAHAIGTVCAIGREALQVRPEQLEELRFLAAQVVQKLEARRRAIGVADLERSACADFTSAMVRADRREGVDQTLSAKARSV